MFLVGFGMSGKSLSLAICLILTTQVALAQDKVPKDSTLPNEEQLTKTQELKIKNEQKLPEEVKSQPKESNLNETTKKVENIKAQENTKVKEKSAKETSLATAFIDPIAQLAKEVDQFSVEFAEPQKLPRAAELVPEVLYQQASSTIEEDESIAEDVAEKEAQTIAEKPQEASPQAQEVSADTSLAVVQNNDDKELAQDGSPSLTVKDAALKDSQATIKEVAQEQLKEEGKEDTLIAKNEADENTLKEEGKELSKEGSKGGDKALAQATDKNDELKEQSAEKVSLAADNEGAQDFTQENTDTSVSIQKIAITDKMLYDKSLDDIIPLPKKVDMKASAGTYTIEPGIGIRRILHDLYNDTYVQNGITKEMFLAGLYRKNPGSFSTKGPMFPFTNKQLVIPTVEQLLLEDSRTYTEYLAKEGVKLRLSMMPSLNIEEKYDLALKTQLDKRKEYLLKQQSN